MNIQFTGFLGTAPKYDDEQVPDGYSVLSHNTKSERGILEPWALPKVIGASPWLNSKSMFRYNTKWFSWPTLTYAVRAPLKNDPYDYVVIASDGKDPQVAYNLNAESGAGGATSGWVADPKGVDRFWLLDAPLNVYKGETVEFSVITPTAEEFNNRINLILANSLAYNTFVRLGDDATFVTNYGWLRKDGENVEKMSLDGKLATYTADVATDTTIELIGAQSNGQGEYLRHAVFPIFDVKIYDTSKRLRYHLPLTIRGQGGNQSPIVGVTGARMIGYSETVWVETPGVGSLGAYPSVTYPLNVPKPPDLLNVSVATADYWHQETTILEDGSEEVVPVAGQSAAKEDHNGDGIIGIMPYEEPEEVEYDVSEVAYAYCYVDAWGRLSQLSPPSDLVEIKEYQYTNTTAATLVFPPLPESLMATDPIRGTSAKIRIFRTNTATSGTGVYQFVDEIPVTATEYVDTTYSGDLLDAPLNADWTGAPDTDTELYPSGSMKKVAIMGADILVGHNRRLLCFAEPEAFYAWPVKYYKVFQEDIVTIQPAGANLVVLTTGVPYIVQGVHPESMDATRLSDPVPCSSERGVTEVAGAVYFTSDTGLHRIDDYRISNVSDGFLTNKQWRDLDPSTLMLSNYDNKVFVHSPTTGKTLVFDALDSNAGVRTLDLDASCFMQLEATNDLAYVEKDTQRLMQFDSAGSAWLELSWQSKTYLFNDPVSFNLAKVRANAYPVSVTVAYDHPTTGVEKTYTKTVDSPSFFYLPFNARAHRWRVKVDSISQAARLEVRDVQLAQSPEELV
jgi:hypothetical protein